MSTIAQPDASKLPDHLLQAVVAMVPQASWPPLEVIHRGEYSNDFAELRFGDGRTLIVKRGRYDWTARRFAASRAAARLVREAAGVRAPEPLPMPEGLAHRPVEAYWRIEQPTLQEVWDDLDRPGRESALRSCGRLISRLHAIELDGFGPLGDAATARRSLGDYLHDELGRRLRPAIAGCWPEAEPHLARLIEAVPLVERRLGDRRSLVHNDLHLGNVLCERDDAGGVRCTGLIDLETAVSAPPEADFAAIDVHHGDGFPLPIAQSLRALVRRSAPEPLDPVGILFFRALHLLNMGFHSAVIGHDWHAGRLLERMDRELGSLSRITRRE